MFILIVLVLVCLFIYLFNYLYWFSCDFILCFFIVVVCLLCLYKVVNLFFPTSPARMNNNYRQKQTREAMKNN